MIKNLLKLYFGHSFSRFGGGSGPLITPSLCVRRCWGYKEKDHSVKGDEFN